METLDPKTLPKAKAAVIPSQANDLLAKAHDQLQTRSETPSPNETPEKLPRALLDKLWIKMTEMYGHRWTANFGVLADPNHSWASVLKGLNGTQIANGLNTLVEKPDEFDWPPPANVFRAMCLQVPGMPSIKDAWTEALIGVYSHEGVRVAAEATSTFDLRTAKQGDKALFQRFERNYAIVMRRAQTGQPLEGRIAKGIGSDSSRPREQVQLEHSRNEVDRIVDVLEIPKDPKACRAMLLAQFKIRRDDHA
ncbi:hypothetical protein HUW52_27425 [Pseudomonas sp. 43A]|uniref:hypothetical protein n=1 Tax=unclassified Pseudomonas TaxID=196821 RepID=UPI00158732FB|nr:MULTISPECIES: hypothetical protein [unclassified Pseudomonas]QKV66488.1 hypothetical protein HUW52_27425 [Pseudomonas sp. 43A]QMW11059.1 hypothetical protein H3303_05280 [Pseudomonas sp. 29A]